MEQLKEVQRSLQLEASLLGDYNLISKTELANKYCDAEEAWYEAKMANDIGKSAYYDKLRSAYYSAIMLRYWYKIFEWMKNSSSLNLEPVDFVEWLEHGLWVAFYYKTWRWEYKAKCKHGRFIEWELDENGNKIPNPYYWVKDPNAPDKMINRCCASIRGREYQYYNKINRRTNVQTYSLDELLDENGDFAMSYAGDACKEESPISGCKILIQTLLKRGDGVEALILDGIANYDSFKEVKSKENGATKINYEFNSRKLVKHLTTIDEHFISQFCEIYDIEPAIGNDIYSKLKSLNNAKLYKLIENVQKGMRNSPDLIECLLP